jgi:hypothetical protein
MKGEQYENMRLCGSDPFTAYPPPVKESNVVPPHPAARSAAGCGGSLEDELCPDEIEGWKVKDGSPSVLPHFGDNLLRGLILGAGGDKVVGK